LLNIHINSIDVKEQYSLHSENYFDKICYVDLKATINNELVVNIEMQNYEDENFLNRIVIYKSALNREQVKSGKNYDVLKRVVGINIVEHTLFDDIPDYFTTWRYRADNNLNYIPTKFKISDINVEHYVELEKFRNSEHTFENRLDLWLAYIDGTNPKWVEKAMKENKIIAEAERLRKEYLADEKNRELIDAYEIWKLGQNTREKRAEEKGKAEGFADGVNLTIISMHKKGIDVKTIAEIVNKTEEEVNAIITKK
ncbi:MAG: Rpn family recombination-promoting nuclease/putative transposase, partial [Clostridia bacterium]|nr:Rpn family recombination-promoting nuclease/putative transposase [Clostridia bacterium]